MPSLSKGPRITTKQYYELEVYFFKLALFTDSKDYFDLSDKDRQKIDNEIIRISNVLELMQLFRNKNSNEVPVVAWKQKLSSENEFRRLFRFTTVSVAAMCLDIPTTKIVAVCQGHQSRKTAGGYVFKYESDYDQNEETIFDHNINRIKAKNYGRNVENAH